MLLGGRPWEDNNLSFITLTKHINITATLLTTLNLHRAVANQVAENKRATSIIWKAAYSQLSIAFHFLWICSMQQQSTELYI
jgi:hydrogenase-4 membrane subunit HyfE